MNINDPELLQMSKSRWLQGDWQSLAKLEDPNLLLNKDHADLLLLAAVGRFHRGDTSKALKLVEAARDKGCDYELLISVVISTAYLSLSRAAIYCGNSDNAKKYLLKSAGVVMPSCESLESTVKVRLADELSRASQELELRQLFATQNNGPLGAPVNDGENNRPDSYTETSVYDTNPRFSSRAYEYYRSSGEINAQSKFFLIDSKSLPRSGLHYLKNTLTRLLPGHFSFCEWYQEPGCCRQMPCSLTAYAEASRVQGSIKVRLVKSHDFNLDDPAFPLIDGIQRLVLIRHPLFILTSWFELDRIAAYQSSLLEHGLDLKKLYFLHEPEVISHALRLLDAIYEPIGSDALQKWLVDRVRYISGFLRRWAYPIVQDPKLEWRVVSYDQLNSYLIGLLAPMQDLLSSDAQDQFNRFLQRSESHFAPRRDPFMLKSSKVMEEVTYHSNLFRVACNEIALTNEYSELARQINITDS